MSLSDKSHMSVLCIFFYGKIEMRPYIYIFVSKPVFDRDDSFCDLRVILQYVVYSKIQYNAIYSYMDVGSNELQKNK